MILLLLVLSLAINIIFVWYIRTLIRRYLVDAETVDKFSEMLGQYVESLNSIYRLEELYGDETLKKAITQTNFVIEACEEFKGSLASTPEKAGEESVEQTKEEAVIRLKEGEKVSQSASQYKRIILN